MSTKKKRHREKGEKLHKYLSVAPSFEHYPLESDYTNENSIPYPWRDMEFLLDLKRYINGLVVHKSALPVKAKPAYKKKIISRNILLSEAKGTMPSSK